MGNFLSFPDLRNSLSIPGFMFSVVGDTLSDRDCYRYVATHVKQKNYVAVTELRWD